jgi:phosphate:Na+ symporter
LQRRRRSLAIKADFARLRERRGALTAQATPLDLLRDLRRLNDHLVAGAAYPVLEAGGDRKVDWLTTGSA